jgi:hypothetical protein
MPNPLFLEVMGVTYHEYNTYSPAKKARFQREAQKRLVAVHEKDITAYNKLTSDAVNTAVRNAEDAAAADIEDQEND